MNNQIYNLTRDMSDLDFEHELAEVRAARQAWREGTAYARQLDTATFGLSAKYALRESRPEGDKLFESLLISGMNAAEARAHIRSL
jgi:hypothetical protein